MTKGKTIRRVSRFQGGHQGATYKCRACGKLTRETGECESGVDLCVDCYLRAGDENEVSDGNMTREEFNAKWEAR